MAEELRAWGRVTVATHNAGKLAELADGLYPLGLKVAGVEELTPPVEGHDSFEANALLKARHAATALGVWALADDSGLCVDALGGAPGVDTADYGGWERLLDALKDTPAPRPAAFVCVLVLCSPDGRHISFTGSCKGEITVRPHGAGGFGYDPVFQPEGALVTFAEMTRAEKQRASHRGLALQAFYKWLA